MRGAEAPKIDPAGQTKFYSCWLDLPLENVASLKCLTVAVGENKVLGIAEFGFLPEAVGGYLESLRLV